MAKKENNEKLVTLSEWVWTTGYKGTNKNMCCKDYQYELGKQHDMPKDAEIKDCDSGFHLCLKLEDVFRYYNIGDGNRFFKVKALVRVNDLTSYGKSVPSGLFAFSRDKLAAKSIVFERELTPDEILTDEKYSDYTEEEKLATLEHGPRYVELERKIVALVGLGYTRPLSEYIVCSAYKYELAYALGSQPELNMNVKICLIFDKANQIMIDTGSMKWPKDDYLSRISQQVMSAALGNAALERGSR